MLLLQEMWTGNVARCWQLCASTHRAWRLINALLLWPYLLFFLQFLSVEASVYSFDWQTLALFSICIHANLLLLKCIQTCLRKPTLKPPKIRGLKFSFENVLCTFHTSPVILTLRSSKSHFTQKGSSTQQLQESKEEVKCVILVRASQGSIASSSL